MNYFSCAATARRRNSVSAERRIRPALTAVLLLALLGGGHPALSDTAAAAGRYGLVYTVRLDPLAGNATVASEVTQTQALLRQVRMSASSRFSGFRGGGTIDATGDSVVWEPSRSGGKLEWDVSLAHRRNGDGYDAWLGPDWGIFRAEDVIPRAATRTLGDAASRTTLRVEVPRGWSVVTQYPEVDGEFLISNPERRFDQPSGWILVGKIGVRRETIAGIRVAVAGPVGQAIRRMDTLALLNWTLPELARLLPWRPERLTIISAADPMWRGGLSAPLSVFVHADRPLISENGTSTILHEIMHMALGMRAKPGSDWIIEGLAEFYSLELLRRSGTITAPRFRHALQDQARWGEKADALCTNRSSGATTALAVTILAALDTELRKTSGRKLTLDDAVQELARRGPVVGIADLRASVETVKGQKSDSLHINKLPGCRNMQQQIN